MSRNNKRRIPDAIDSGWFQRIFGFNEVVGDYNTNQYRLQQMQLLQHDPTILQRSSDGMLLHCGSFELPYLSEMRQQCQQLLIQIKQLQQQQLDSKSKVSSDVTTTTTTDQQSPSILFGPIHAMNIQNMDVYLIVFVYLYIYCKSCMYSLYCKRCSFNEADDDGADLCVGRDDDEGVVIGAY